MFSQLLFPKPAASQYLPAACKSNLDIFFFPPRYFTESLKKSSKVGTCSLACLKFSAYNFKLSIPSSSGNMKSNSSLF